MKISERTEQLLRCPVCRGVLQRYGSELACANQECKACFPIIKGVPVLINESNSLFSIEDIRQHEHASADRVRSGLLARLLPDITLNVKGPSNYRKFASLVCRKNSTPRVLVVGGGSVGRGMEVIVENPTIDLVETDVYLGPRTSIICDAHDLPFDDNVFDGVVVQAVLEHVVDPYRCVEEIHRVLNDRGLVYAETPFMQGVHERGYDFTRFTHLGHRRLFRKFEEVDSGAVAGSGTALAWSIRYLLWSFVKSPMAVRIIRLFTRPTLFWIKYIDYILIDKPGTLDGASGYYFLGRKSRRTLSDRELIKLYRGIM